MAKPSKVPERPGWKRVDGNAGWHWRMRGEHAMMECFRTPSGTMAVWRCDKGERRLVCAFGLDTECSQADANRAVARAQAEAEHWARARAPKGPGK